METKAHYILIGVFVLILTAALIGVTVWLGIRPTTKRYDKYVVYMTDSVSGLNKDAPVKYRGVEVGRVDAVSLDKENSERVRLLLDIEKGTPIKEDTIATLELQGITGIAYVNLAGQKSDSPLLQPRSNPPYPVIQSGPSLITRLDQGITHLIASLTSMSDTMNDFLSGPNRESIENSLAHLDRILASLAGQSDAISETIQSASVTLKHSAKAGENLPELLDQLGQASTALKNMSQVIAGQSKDIGTATTHASQNLNQLVEESGLQLRIISADLQRLILRLEKLATSLEENPDSLLFGDPAPPLGPGESKR